MSSQSTTRSVTRDEVADFVGAVRGHLADLPADEQQELTEGLEADLAEQLADPDAAPLGDPADYARELRVAAGLAPRGRRRTYRPAALLDSAHDAWDRRAERLPGDAAGFLLALRPAWWLVRGWAAVALGLAAAGHASDIAIVPAPRNSPGLGLVLLAVAVVGSVQVGRGRLWPGGGRRTGSPLARLVLLALNLLAVVALPLLIGGNQVTMTTAERWSSDAGGDVVPQGLFLNGSPVYDVYPYDAKGNPLVGVQLVDQDGRRLTVLDAGVDAGLEPVLSPWSNGRTKLYSVFPMPSKTIDGATGLVRGQARIRAPYDSLPPVTLDGFLASVLRVPTASTER